MLVKFIVRSNPAIVLLVLVALGWLAHQVFPARGEVLIGLELLGLAGYAIGKLVVSQEKKYQLARCDAGDHAGPEKGSYKVKRDRVSGLCYVSAKCVECGAEYVIVVLPEELEHV